MVSSLTRRVRGRLQAPVMRHLTAATIAFALTIAISLTVIAFWPGGAPLVVPIAGLCAAFAAAIYVAKRLDSRQPYFQTREDVERVLDLPVLAVCPPWRPHPEPGRGNR